MAKAKCECCEEQRSGWHSMLEHQRRAHPKEVALAGVQRTAEYAEKHPVIECKEN